MLQYTLLNLCDKYDIAQDKKNIKYCQNCKENNATQNPLPKPAFLNWWFKSQMWSITLVTDGALEPPKKQRT